MDAVRQSGFLKNILHASGLHYALLRAANDIISLNLKGIMTEIIKVNDMFNEFL